MRPEEFNNLPKEKFVLVNENKKLRDKELVTKPVGFFMDAMHRFGKNKGSIVGAAVIGLLVLFAIVVPIFSKYTVAYNDSYFRYTLPKWTNSETTDFIDGCTNKTLNENSFIYYYSMGAETGHNAIKRQEYTKQKDNMYSFRLDTYQQNGTVFVTLTQKQYNELQTYQDEHNVQIIYPTTALSERPTATQDSSNANYWYKTISKNGITVPTDYTIGADGKITFTNIYQAYSIPAMDSSANEQYRCNTRLIAKDGGYALLLNSLVPETDEEGNKIGDKYEDIGYASVYASDDDNYTELVSTLDEATVFTFDSTLNTLVTNIQNHVSASRDGDYYFGLPKTTGSTVALRMVNDYGADDYCCFDFFDETTGELVTDPIVNTSYYYAANRYTISTSNFYLIGSATGYSVGSSFNNAQKLVIKEVTGGYVIAKENSFTHTMTYVKLLADGNETKLDFNDDNIDNASVFTFNGRKLSTVVNGHTTASKDGAYYFAYELSSKTSTLKYALGSDIDATSTLYYLLTSKTDGTPATVLNDGDNIIFSNTSEVREDKFIYLTGDFKGDNYFSKMRIEGSDNYTYSYATPKAGRQFELRVNYYEYYIYYHQHVLNDKIDQPFFIFGTTSNGQDIFTCLASGARFSFIMAIVVASVNMLVGAIYGAIEGYYGGKVDLIMERIVEILSAVPFMIVITLLKYHMGGTSQAIILFIAFFLTGWIGESGLVRMQFYRFKNQEYVLAARTLGAKDPRIMFKHIFPNSLGTIVTSSVLVIPGMIFSETSLSYLGIINLNSGNLTSVGTLLASAQPYIASFPHMILFPSIFISLLMLCFNLFGNGLRDAFNPSLRGTED